MYDFCTYFDQHYLPRGLALYQSLQQHCSAFQLWVLCMDRVTYDTLSHMQLPHIRLIALEDFEMGDEELLNAKRNRTQVEYYFTCTPSLPLFILNNYSEVEIITYLDADLFFFANPAPIYDEIGNHSIAIIDHRFPPNMRHLQQRGIYNVGWLSFRRDEHAFTCLYWWREQCIEWCYDRVEEGRYADQKYLDDWPTRFQNVVVLQHKGANLAPWNLANYRIHLDGSRIWVDEYPLIFFHFHGLERVNHWLYNSNFTNYEGKLSRIVRQKIYAPYILALSNVSISPFLMRSTAHDNIRNQIPSLFRRVVRRLRKPLRGGRDVLAGRYIFFVNGWVI